VFSRQMGGRPLAWDQDGDPGESLQCTILDYFRLLNRASASRAGLPGAVLAGFCPNGHRIKQRKKV
jgi:hypothetical protein